MAIKKSIEFWAPYIHSTFNEKTDGLVGVSGLLSGGWISYLTPTTVSVSPYKFVQDGLIVENDAATTVTVTDPATETNPIYVLLSSPDAKDTSGVSITVVYGKDITPTAIVLAGRFGNEWVNTKYLSLSSLRELSLKTRYDAIHGRVEGVGGFVSKDLGTSQGLLVESGTVTDSDGARRVLNVDPSVGGGYNRLFDLTDIDPDFPRVDHLVLRKKYDNTSAPADLVIAKGETVALGSQQATASATPTVTVDNTASNVPGSVTDNAAGQHVVVWGNSTNLWRRRMAHTTARAGDTADSLAAGGAVAGVFMADKPNIASGDRLFGCCTAGGEVAIFRTTADGAAIATGSITTLTSTGATASNPHMVIDEDENAHIVYQVSEGSPQNQIYYMKVDITDADFGTIVTAGRYARGYSSGQNDTDPHITIGADGNLHIVYIHGTTTNIYGDVNYLVINDNGATIETEVAISTSVNDGYGSATSSPTDKNVKPRIATSPQGDVYIAFIADYDLGTPEGILFERTMLARTGFRCVRYGVLTYGQSDTSTTVLWFNLFADGLGRPCTFCATNDSVSSANRFMFHKHAPVLVSDGVNIEPDILTAIVGPTIGYSPDIVGVAGQADDGGEARLDRDGSIQVVDEIADTVTHRKFSSQAWTGDLAVDKGVRHPKDTYLQSVSLPFGTADAIASESDVVLHPTRNKGKPPFTAVGRDGDFTGYYGLHQAIESLRGVGGKIVVKSGYYPILHKVRLYSGIELYADGNVIFDCQSSMGSYREAFGAAGVAGVDIATVDAASHSFSIAIAGYQNTGAIGDAILIYDDTGSKPIDLATNIYGPYFITRIVDTVGSVILNRDVSATTGGNYKAIWLASGIRLEGFTILDNRSGSQTDQLISASYLYKPIFRDLKVDSDSCDPTILQSACYEARWDCCNVRGDNAADSMQLDGTSTMKDIATTMNDCNFEGDVSLGATHGYQRLKVNGCQVYSDWVFGAGADEAPMWTNNGGTISEAEFDAISDWAGDATSFINNALINKNITFKSDATSTIGSAAQRLLNLYTEGIEILPSATDGIICKPSNFTSVSDGGALNPTAAQYGETRDPIRDTVAIKRIEPYGRNASAHRLIDDFTYSATSWSAGSTGPWDENELIGGAVSIAAVSYATDADGGVIQFVTSTSTDSYAGLNGMYIWDIDSSANRMIRFVARYTVDSTGENSVDRHDFVGIQRQGGTDRIGFVRQPPPGDSPTPWTFLVNLSGGSTKTANVSGIDVAGGSYQNLYFALEYGNFGSGSMYRAYYWVSGDGIVQYYDLDDPSDTGIVDNGPWMFTAFVHNEGSTALESRLDFVEIWDTTLISG